MLLIVIAYLILIHSIESLKCNIIKNKYILNQIYISKNDIIDAINSNELTNITPIKSKSKSSIVSGGTKKKSVRPQGQDRDIGLINPNRLKIIAGSAKGMKIESPDVYLRPMMAKVREALFSTLEYMDIFTSSNTRVLDIFSGSGSVGLEALSRGAAHTTFIDFSPECIDISLKNSQRLGFENKAKGVCCKAQDVLSTPEKFNLIEPYQLITLTPPYEEVVYEELLNCLCDTTLVSENTIIVIEYPVEMGTLPYVVNDKLFGLRNRRYGRTVIAIYVYRPSKSFDMHPDEFLPNSIKRK